VLTFELLFFNGTTLLFLPLSSSSYIVSALPTSTEGAVVVSVDASGATGGKVHLGVRTSAGGGEPSRRKTTSVSSRRVSLVGRRRSLELELELGEPPPTCVVLGGTSNPSCRRLASSFGDCRCRCRWSERGGGGDDDDVGSTRFRVLISNEAGG
jgi:hypothetical protein